MITFILLLVPYMWPDALAFRGSIDEGSFVRKSISYHMEYRVAGYLFLELPFLGHLESLVSYSTI